MTPSLDYAKARETMVEQQVRPWDVLDPRVLDVLAAVPREAFFAEAHRALAYADLELPLGHGASMMKPVVEGRMLQALQLQPGDSVLEVGTGSGYISACLGALAREVVARLPDTRVIVVSGYTDMQLDPGLVLLGKPFRLKDLRDCVISTTRD